MYSSNNKRIAFVVSIKNAVGLAAGPRDAQIVYDLLTDPSLGACSEYDSEPLIDCESRTEFQEKLMKKIEDWDSQNQLIFYFTGHGITKKGTYCLQFGNLERDYLPFHAIQEDLKMQGVSKAIIILDACYSGSALKTKNNNSIIDTLNIPKGFVLLASSRSFEVSEELSDGTASVFTEILCDGIRSGIGKPTNDGYIYTEDLMQYIISKLISDKRYTYFNQKPVYSIIEADNRIWLSKNPNGIINDTTKNTSLVTSVSNMNELEIFQKNTAHTLHPCPNANIEDMNWILLEMYIREAKMKFSSEDSKEYILSKIGLFSPIQLRNKNVLHKSAVLCFTYRPEIYYQYANSIFLRGSPRDKGSFYREEVFGSLNQQIIKLLELTIDSLDIVAHTINNGTREPVYDVDKDLIREVIANAIVHRDYSLPSRTQVKVTDNTIEIASPGNFPENISWEYLIDNNNDFISHPIDAAITLYIARLGEFDGIGRGFDYIRNYISQNGEQSITCKILPNPAVFIRILRHQNLGVNNQKKFITRERIINAAQQIESDRLLNLRLQGFVGRIAELAAIREQIETIRPTGGYVLIKAAAGEGKSSSIAKLIQNAGITHTPHHFIALTTGREYQLGLLRVVVAQLILKYNLTVSYFPEESYPAMKAEFARILDELSSQGIQETIYLDGLDQLQPEIDGSRDLSFLPPQPPPGIVIVLGSRPDETLKPLEILHRVDYPLPPLSEADALEFWRSVQPDVADDLLHDLYTALKGNALFVHLAADTMRDQSMADATSLITQIEQNPQNLFGITLDRIKGRSRSQWDAVWKPMLALLLVAQEPLRLDVLGDFLEQDHDIIQDAVWVLGGLVSHGIDHRVALHHLLFRDYLAVSVFNQREVKRWHQRLADWCAKDLDSIWNDDRDLIEQARRVYARHHYITHLSLAENWTTLWQVLDTGDYGEHKTRFDPSTRLYALDLDRGRECVIKVGQSLEEHIQNLSRLWKYSLLRTSLTSRVDQWPDDLFVVLAMLGRTQEVLDRIELLSSRERQIQLWENILPWCSSHQQSLIRTRQQQQIRQIATINQGNSLIQPTKNDNDTDDTISNQHNTLIDAAQTAAANGHLSRAISIVDTIDNARQRADVLATIAKTAIAIGDFDCGINLLDQIINITDIIDNRDSRIHSLLSIARVTASSGDFERAIVITNMIDDVWVRTEALTSIAQTITALGNIDRALAITLEIDRLDKRAKALATIANESALLGNFDQAKSILDEAIMTARAIDDSTQRSEALSTIVITTATLGDIDRALSITQSIDGPIYRIEALGAIAKKIGHGHHEDAIAILDNALVIAQSIDNIGQYADALYTIATAAATIGDIDRALSIAQSITNIKQSSQTFSSIATAAAIIGDIDRALSITQSIDDPIYRIEALDTITKEIVSHGHHEDAIAILDNALVIAQSINEPTYRADALSTIATTTAALGDTDRALSIAQSIEESTARVDALKVIFQTTNAVTKTLGMVQNEWSCTTITQELWTMTPIITPLIRDYPWLGTAILESEVWVNKQLNRLG